MVKYGENQEHSLQVALICVVACGCEYCGVCGHFELWAKRGYLKCNTICGVVQFSLQQTNHP